MNRWPNRIIIEYDKDNKSVAGHEIHREMPGEDGFYRSSRTFNAFHACMHQRTYDSMYNGKVFGRRFYITDTPHYNPLAEAEPQVFHRSIWEFYKYIGWDFKKKKFL